MYSQLHHWRNSIGNDKPSNNMKCVLSEREKGREKEMSNNNSLLLCMVVARIPFPWFIGKLFGI